MSTKRVVKKKSASKKPSRPELSTHGKSRVPDALENPEANVQQTREPKSEKAKRVAKVLNISISIDDSDRKRTYEKFVEDVKKSLGAVEPPWIDDDGNRIPGPHVAVTGGYYILDGKVCRPEDYDKKLQGFKTGATPPSWAGGPSAPATQFRQMDWDLQNLTSDEYDQKYGLGKYAPKPAWTESNSEHMNRMKTQRAEAKRVREAQEDEGLEEFDWEDEDVLDDAKMGKVADKSASAAVRKMKGSKGKKRVVKNAKKPAKKTAAKKVVRRKK